MFGFGVGQMTVNILKYNFSLGETIEGKLIIKLKKPVKAKEISIQLLGEKRIARRTEKGVSYTTKKVFDFKYPLDGEKEYPAGQELVYDFRIKIPQDIFTKEMIPGNLGNFVKAVEVFSGNTSATMWYLVGRMAVPWKIDVSKKVQINIA